MLGNTIGQKRRIRQGLNQMYVERSRKMLQLSEKYGAIRPGDRLLEIGTGWMHWESTIFRLFYDVEVTLFDVWDNRQLSAYKHFFRQFEQVMDTELALQPLESKRAHALLREVLAAPSFEKIYELLNFTYVINPGGTLEHFQDEAFSLIFSCNVLEHINKQILPGFLSDYYRLLKRGGHSIHMIDLGDHLYYYDRRVSYKNYLRYSDATWKRYFQNEVQYFNRVQRPEWLELYERAGLAMLEEEAISKDIGSINIDENYRHLGQENLRCVTLWVIHGKP